MNSRKYIILLIALFLSIETASATDWTITNPVSFGHTNYVSDQFVITGNFALVGNASTYNLAGDGTYTASVLFSNMNNGGFAMINPIDNTRWGTDEQGNVFYTTSLSPIDYSAGFFTIGVGGTCSGLGGNCNNLHRVGTITPETYPVKMYFDSSGNVYLVDVLTLRKYVKSLGYTPQAVRTLTAAEAAASDIVEVNDGGNDCDTSGCTYRNLGIFIDSSGYIHLLFGAQVGAAASVNAGDGGLHHVVLTSSGAKYTSSQIASNTKQWAAASADGFSGGGLVADETNGIYNYTYGYRLKSTNGGGEDTVYVLHNSTTGTVDVGGGDLTTLTTITDIAYNNFQIYVVSPTQDLVRSMVTNYEGASFSGVPPNEAGITGTFTWVNGYGSSVTTITPGMALSYRWTISNELDNYTFFSGWGTDTQTEPGELHDLTDLTGLGVPAVFPTSSNDLAGTSIYGYLLARRDNDSQWSLLTNPQLLSISPASIGYDSITLDKTFYNLTGDTIAATFTYSSGYPPYFYQWQLCTRADCADGTFFNQKSLIGEPSTSSMATDGLQEGNYYAVLMRHLPFLSNTIVALQRFEVRPPVIGLSWDKPTYNLQPKTSNTTCLDSTPTANYFNNISGYAGLQSGWFSCSSVPADASANNSVMRASLFARYNGTFYLNNSLGNIWNGTLNNGSGALIYVLTNSSPTETWTLSGLNNSTPGCGCGNETFYANAEVEAESQLGYSISVSPKIAYNGDTLYITFTKPIYKLLDYVIVKDADGSNVVSFKTTDTSGTYYIDPNKQYKYGTWTAYWVSGSENRLFDRSTTVFTFAVKNAGRPHTTPSIEPENPNNNIVGASSKILQLPWFGLIALIVTIIGLIKHGANGLQFTFAIAITTTIAALIGIWNEWGIYITIMSWLLVAGFFKLSKSQEV